MLYQFKLIDYDEFIQKGGKLAESTMVINIPSEDVKYPVFSPIGFVVDTSTNQPFYYDSVVTVPSEPGKLISGIYDYPIWVYDSPPCLAPAHTINGNTDYLHPSNLNQADKDRLTEFYRQQLRDLDKDLRNSI